MRKSGFGSKVHVRISGWITVVVAVLFFVSLFSGCQGDKGEQAKKHFEKGVEQFGKKQMQEALSEFQKAVELNPDYADARFYLGGLHHTLKDYDAALGEYKKVMQLDPGYPGIHTATANIYYELGLTSWGRAVKLDRTSFWLPDTSRKLPYQDRAELDKLIEDYLKTVRSDTVDAETVSKLSQAYFILAAQEYENAIQANASDTGAQLYLGLTYSEQGYDQRAWDQHELLKELAPSAADMLQSVLNQKEKEKEQLENLKKGGGKK
jgi:Tfp pilus assembly protein PilF